MLVKSISFHLMLAQVLVTGANGFIGRHLRIYNIAMVRGSAQAGEISADTLDFDSLKRACTGIVLLLTALVLRTLLMTKIQSAIGESILKEQKTYRKQPLSRMLSDLYSFPRLKRQSRCDLPWDFQTKRN